MSFLPQIQPTISAEQAEEVNTAFVDAVTGERIDVIYELRG